jgi:hypothetical protein
LEPVVGAVGLEIWDLVVLQVEKAEMVDSGPVVVAVVVPLMAHYLAQVVMVVVAYVQCWNSMATLRHN